MHVRYVLGGYCDALLQLRCSLGERSSIDTDNGNSMLHGPFFSSLENPIL